MNLKEVIIYLFICLQILQINTHGKCASDKLKIKPKINTAMEKEKDLRLLQQKPWEEIKIVVDYTFLDSQSGKVDQKMIDLSKKVTENCMVIFTNLLIFFFDEMCRVKIRKPCI